MMTRLSTVLLATSVIISTACAQESASAQSEPVKAQAVKVASASAASMSGVSADTSDWRDVNQDNLLYITTSHGKILVELFPEIAPAHVKQIKALAGQKFYDFITFHRVIEGFMNQTGDPTGTGTGDSDLPNIPAEFTFRRDPGMKVTLLNKRAVDQSNPNKGTIDVGFYNGLPVASQPAMQASLTKDGKVEAWGLHCVGVTSMARSNNPNSGNSQFFLMRDTANFLDQKYSIWGRTVWGDENLTKIKVGTKGETVGFVPDQMESVRLGSALAPSEQLNVQVLKTSSAAFKNYLKTQKTPDGTYADICDIAVPNRIRP